MPFWADRAPDKTDLAANTEPTTMQIVPMYNRDIQDKTSESNELTFVNVPLC